MASTPEQPTPALSVFDDAYASRTALVHVRALSDTGPGFGPQVSDATIREAFSQRWVLEDLRPAQYRGAIVRDEHAIALHRQIGEFVDPPAWLARARRI
jgi:hypothetical protein